MFDRGRVVTWLISPTPHYSQDVSRRVQIIGVVLVLLASACGGGDEASSSISPTAAPTTSAVVGEASPSEAVAFWVDTLAVGSYHNAGLVVGEDQVVLLIAVESYSPEVYAQLADDGIGQDMSRSFWSSFVGGFEAFTGAAITEVVVGEERRFRAGGQNFAEVDLLSSRGEATVIAVEEERRWFVDVLATFGPSFASLFNLWVERLPPDATAPRAALREQSISLTVARDRLDRELDAGAVAELDLLLESL